MKITCILFTAFPGLLLAGCINSRQAETKLLNPSFVSQSPIAKKQNTPADSLVYKLIAGRPDLFNSVLSQKDELKIQVIYTQIDRGKKPKDKVKLTDHTFNLNPDNYFYPASTVKLPVAILALQKLNELNIPGVNKNTTMITGEDGDGQTEVVNDPSAPDGRPTIAHYIKKILLVSDNDAFNRLYEFLGQEYIHSSLNKMGYSDVRIIHRLSISLTENQNRHTNPVTFIDTAGNILYAKPAEKSRLSYEPRTTMPRNYFLGQGYMQGDKLVNEPFDFSKKNLLPLKDLHDILKSIMFPKSVPTEKQFNLSNEDYDFLRLYMSMRPAESKSPVYNNEIYWDNYVKMIFYGAEKGAPQAGIRIFNKTGTAYGFLTDACYFADFKNNIEFLLSAVIYCNSDGIFNDDKYDYKEVGYPFLKNLGRVVYDYELKRQKKNPADLSSFQFGYTE